MRITKDNPPGQTLSVSETQCWRRGELLGKGHFGSVHVATLTEPRDPRFKNCPPVMAVKSSDEPSSRAELESERLHLLRFRDCPHVIRYLGMDETPAEDGTSRLNLFLELATGGTLAKLIWHADGPLNEPVVRRYARSILAAVEWIHERGYVHCDLKPENVLLVREGDEFVAKVADFGAAKMAGNGLRLRGTMCYMAPESVKFGVQVKEGDIWALGCIVLKMLGGRLPWEGRNKDEMRRMIATVRPVFLDEISGKAANFLRKCLARNRYDRDTASQLMSHPFVQERKEDEEEEEEDDDDHYYYDDDGDEAKCEGRETVPIREFLWREWFNNLFKCLLP